MRLRTDKFLLKILPFLLSFVLGLIIFGIIDYFEMKNSIENVLNEICGSLIGVPVVFLCYQIVSELSNAKLKDIMFKYARINIDKPARDLAEILAKKFKLKEFDADVILNNKKLIEQKLASFRGLNIEELQAIYDEFSRTLRNSNVYESIDPEELRRIFRLNNNISYLIYEIKNKDKKMVVQKVYKIVNYLDGWFDYCNQTLLYK